MFAEFFDAYGVELIMAILSAIFGGLGLIIKRFLNDNTKRSIAKVAMMSVEQLWKELHGADKLIKALEYAETLLAKRGLKFDADEMRIMIEAAVGEFNGNVNAGITAGTTATE